MISCKHFCKNSLALFIDLSFSNISIIPPYTSFTIGALSRRFNTSPIDFLYPHSISSSYNTPTYRFLDNNANGRNVFSYSKSCGYFKKDVAISPASLANSIVISKAFLSLIGVPSNSSKLNVKNTESVSP